MKTLKDALIKGKKVLVRVDYNVPMESGKITENERIKDTLQTINYILDNGGSVILISHLGRPEGKTVKSMSLAPVAAELENLLGKKVQFVAETVGLKAREAAKGLKPGEVLLLENLRFSPLEELGDREFAGKLASMADLFVQEAFSNAHRAHASMVAITEVLPSYAGFLFEKEYTSLNSVLSEPARPFVVVAGGKKLETKVDLLKSIAKKADIIVVGGGMGNTFLVAEGYDVGKSFYEEEYITEAEDILREAHDSGVEVLIPDDVIVASSVSESVSGEEKMIEQLGEKDIIVDIGPKTIAKYSEPLKFAGTIFWNGPLGIAEYENFSKGTRAIAKIIGASDAKSVVGGGDTVAVLGENGLENFTYISNGGGASMEFISGKKMPAVEALQKVGG